MQFNHTALHALKWYGLMNNWNDVEVDLGWGGDQKFMVFLQKMKNVEKH